ncbi:MAG: hypothetical protein Q8P33_00450 [bacterium]|nr:hypothetical protein [bacterium]
MKDLIRVGKISWPALLKRWRSGEIKDDEWTRYWKNNGFASWEEWRKPLLDFGASKKWILYDIEDPLKTVPRFFSGPFKDWRRFYFKGQFSVKFATLVKKRGVGQSTKIRKLLNDFPKHTTLFGVLHDSRVYIVDGMHRACALSLIGSAPARSKKFNQAVRVQIALTGMDIYKASREVNVVQPKSKRV